MSKIRENIPIPEGELAFPEEGDLHSFVTFTQRRSNDKHVLAGYVDATDGAMALAFAKEHYGQDQKCVSIWAFPITAIAGTHADHPTSSEEGPVRAFEIFVRKQCGEPHVEAGRVEAASSESALQAARKMLTDSESIHSVWVIDRCDIHATAEGDVIWRTTDQSYRLARGYAKDVRRKWEEVRAAEAVSRYQSEDLQQTF